MAPRRPHPAWMCPILFGSTACHIGAMPILQGWANNAFGANAELYFNAALGLMSLLSAVSGPALGAWSDRHTRKHALALMQAVNCAPALLLYSLDLSRPDRFGWSTTRKTRDGHENAT